MTSLDATETKHTDGPNAATGTEPAAKQARASGPIILDVSKVTRTFGEPPDEVHALRGVNVRVHRGEFVAIMGASGSGKSTMVHICGGLEVPTSGKVLVDGTDLAQLSDKQRTLFRRRRMGVIFQSFNLLPTLSAIENIKLPLLVDNLDPDDIDARAEAQLRRVHLEGRRDHRPDAMSGGEQQRVAVARALVNDPAIILADEPTGNLDSKNAQEIWALLRRLTSEFGKTVLMITHEAAGAAMADRVLVLRDGVIRGEFEAGGAGDAALVAARYAELAG